MNIDETRIQHLLFNNLISKGHEIVVPNVSWSWLSWEADLISITKSGYMHEFEIKISRYDFEKDFKKRKHNSLKRAIFHKNSRVPSRFWYVAPIDAIPICIPEHAGLMLVFERSRGKFKDLHIEKVKTAPQLHKNKIPGNGIHAILRSIMFKYWKLAHTLDTNKIQRDLFTNPN